MSIRYMGSKDHSVAVVKAGGAFVDPWDKEYKENRKIIGLTLKVV